MDERLKEIRCDCAIIDVKKHRRVLLEYLNGGKSLERQMRPPYVVIIGRLNVDYMGNDDGTSREFMVDVSRIELSDQAPELWRTDKDGKR